MDILDIAIARALTPQGEIDTYAAQARQAVTNANSAVATATSAAEQASEASETASQAAAQATTILENLDTSITETVQDELNSLSLNKTVDNNTIGLQLKYDDTTISNIENLIQYYPTTGSHTDGTMSQAAITAALSNLERKIDEGGSSPSQDVTTNLGQENAGKIVVVGTDGNIIAGSVDEEAIINSLIDSGIYELVDTVGLEIDYVNANYTRVQEAATLTAGNDFDKYTMYGGRIRCNVNDAGRIVAWYGDSNYKEDGSNGQVMYYQPKFYYRRIPMTMEESNGNKVIRKESILISSKKQPGFKLHPLFLNKNNEELDYVLISAYEGSAQYSNGTYDMNDSSDVNFNRDKLSSIANAKPISGINKNLTLAAAEQMAQNRGANWHITTFEAESANQMLEIVELGQLNTQRALSAGIVNIPNNSSYNCASLTGSTSNLGNTTGTASSTRNEINGIYNTYTDADKTAVNYRGFENPYGNIWRFIGNILINGDGAMRGGTIYLCNNYNYTLSNLSNYTKIDLTVPGIYSWISGFGYASEAYDWAFIPCEAENGNSITPVGDSFWSQNNLNSSNIVTIGGAWPFGDRCGIFCYAFDKPFTEANKAQSARLMFIPNKDSNYTANIQSWTAQMGG